MHFEKRKKLCKIFFSELMNELNQLYAYELVPSCNRDDSLYFVPKGTIDQITYYSKPAMSFRFSDHWNWYANLRKCRDQFYIQCESVDLPNARKRKAPGYASEPIRAAQVAICDRKGFYHCIYGDCFDWSTNSWKFIQWTPQMVINRYFY